MLFLFNVKMRCKLLSSETREVYRHPLSLKARSVASPKTLNLKTGPKIVELDGTFSVTLSFSHLAQFTSDLQSVLTGGHLVLA